MLINLKAVFIDHSISPCPKIDEKRKLFDQNLIQGHMFFIFSKSAYPVMILTYPLMIHFVSGWAYVRTLKCLGIKNDTALISWELFFSPLTIIIMTMRCNNNLLQTPISPKISKHLRQVVTIP